MEFGLEELFLRQTGLVFGDQGRGERAAEGVLHHLAVFGGAEEHADGRPLVRFAHVPVEGFEVELQFAQILRLELIYLEFNGHETVEAAMEEEQVEGEIPLFGQLATAENHEVVRPRQLSHQRCDFLVVASRFHLAPPLFNDKHHALVQFVKARLQVCGEGIPEFIRVSDGPVAVLLRGRVGAEVLGEDVGRPDGLDQGRRGPDVGVVERGGDEQDVHVRKVLEMFLQQDRVPRLVEFAAVQRQDVAAVVQVGVAIDGEVRVPVQGAPGFDGDAGDLKGLVGTGHRDPIFRDAERPGLFETVGRQDEATAGGPGQNPGGGLAEVVAVAVGDELDVQGRGDVLRGDRGWPKAGVAVQVQVEGDQATPGADEPPQIAQPAEADAVFDGQEFLQDRVHGAAPFIQPQSNALDGKRQDGKKDQESVPLVCAKSFDIFSDCLDIQDIDQALQLYQL